MTTKERNSQSLTQQKPAGNSQKFGGYISKRFLFVLLALFITAGVLYPTLIHPRVMQYWYEKQDLPVFTLDSSYLAGYSGRAKLLHSDGSLIYEGEFAHGLYEGQGKLRDGDKLYDGSFVAGLFEGVGKLYKNGSLMYEGEFAAGKYNGIGTEYNSETGYKMFEGRFLAGERMAAGITYDENGEAVIPAIPEYLDPSSLLGTSYEDTISALVKAGISYRSISNPDGILLLVDDTGGVVYNFVVDKDTARPQNLAKVHYM